MQEAPIAFQWNVRIAPSGKDRATAYVRKHRFDVGAPLHFDKEYGAISALEYVLGAIGADILNGFRALARKRRIDVSQVEALVQGELNNPLTHLGVVGEEGHPGLEKIRIKVFINSLAEPEAIQRVWDETLEKSPLARTFRGAAGLEMSISTTA